MTSTITKGGPTISVTKNQANFTPRVVRATSPGVWPGDKVTVRAVPQAPRPTVAATYQALAGYKG